MRAIDLIRFRLLDRKYLADLFVDGVRVQQNTGLFVIIVVYVYASLCKYLDLLIDVQLCSSASIELFVVV